MEEKPEIDNIKSKAGCWILVVTVVAVTLLDPNKDDTPTSIFEGPAMYFVLLLGFIAFYYVVIKKDE